MKIRLTSFCTLILFLAAGIFPLSPAKQAAAAPLWDEEDIPVETIDLVEGAGSSNPGDLFALGDILFFSADDKYGRELWKLTPPYKAANLRRVADIMPGDSGSHPSNFATVGETLFFSANDGVHGFELWRSEPPYNSAHMVFDINPYGHSNPANLTAIGNAIFFKADDGSNGSELWKSSPPYRSAELVKDIWPGGSSSDPKELLSIGWTLLFTANDGTGREVWKSEPPYSPASTKMVKDIYPGGGDSEPQELTRVENTLFFTAFDGVSHELWYSKPPFDSYRTIRANEFDYKFPSQPSSLQAYGENLFFSANIGTSGFEPRHSAPPYDVERTYRIEDVLPGFGSSYPQTKGVSSTGVWFFTANDGVHGEELWATAPPYTSAWLVRDIRPGATGSQIRNFVAIGSSVYFSANDGSNGFELWRSTPPYEPDNTRRLTDFRGDATLISPSKVVPLGRKLFFSAYDIDSGSELRIIEFDITGLPNTGFAPRVVTKLPSQPATHQYNASGGLRLQISTLGIDIPIVGVPELTGDWDVTWLGADAGYLEGTAFPTTPGNTVLTGHSYLSNGAAGPFARLSTLKWGDRLEIRAWGQRYTYEVREVRLTSPDDISVLIRHEDLDWVTLVTCQGFNEENNTYKSRVVVRAVLISVSN